MINKIGIENFRVFKDYTEFQLGPITILTGPNNSGKSSFLKLLSLLQYSFKSDGGLNFLNFDGGNHNLGNYDKVTNWKNNSKQVKIITDFSLNYFDEKFKLELIYIPDNDNGKLISFKIFNNKRILLNYFSSYAGSDFDVIQSPSKSLYNYYSLDLEYVKYSMTKNSEPNNETLLFNYYLEKEGQVTELNASYKEIFKSFEDNFKHYYYPFDILMGENNNYDYLTDNIEFILDRPQNSFELYFDRYKLKNSESSDYFFKEFIDDFLVNKPTKKMEDNFLQTFEQFKLDFSKIKIKLKEDVQKNFDKYIDQNIKKGIKKLLYTFNNINHLSATRGSKSRILSNRSTNDIDEIVKEFSLNENNIDFVKEAFKILGVKGDLIIERNEGVSSIVYLKQGQIKINLSDLGFGYSQIIPIILKIINISSNIEKEWYQVNPYEIDDLDPDFNKSPKDRTFDYFAKSISDKLDKLNKLTKYPILVIEEPEANLHPNFQSKLANILVLANKTFNVHFVLETHSEYLIRKLQYLTAKEDADKDDVIIYYFNDDKYVTDKEKKVKEIKINKFGGLTDNFGPGFYDEATSLKFELMKLNQAQNN